MRLQVSHVTRYRYSGPITETHMEMRLRPSKEMGQRLTSFELELLPETALREYVDGFGNYVHYFDYLPEHDLVEVTSRSVVETGGRSRPPADGDRPEDLLLFRPPIVDASGVRRRASNR